MEVLHHQQRQEKEQLSGRAQEHNRRFTTSPESEFASPREPLLCILTAVEFLVDEVTNVFIALDIPNLTGLVQPLHFPSP